MTTHAKVIKDSISPEGVRLTTVEATFPYVVHAQLLTHRVFSRNAQSNRAIPVKKLIQRIKENPYTPVFRANQKGMVAGKPIGQFWPSIVWSLARSTAIFAARTMSFIGVHKETSNRLLLPFMHMTVLITSTEWDNFFELRIEDNAQPEIQELGIAIKNALDGSEPKLLKPGEWHLPYVDDETITLYTARKLSVARCARVSYLNHDNSKPSAVADLELYEDLITSKPIHGSPAEHQATPSEPGSNGITHWKRDGERWSNNLRGWIQLRAIL